MHAKTKSFDTKLGPQGKDWEKSYQVRQNLVLFWNLVSLIYQNC